MNQRIRILGPLAAMALLVQGCGTQYEEVDRLPSRGARGTVSRDWNTMSGVQLGNLGLEYKADSKQAYRNVVRTLGKFGLTIRRARPGWGFIDTTEPSTRPRDVTRALLKKYNKTRFTKPARNLRYTVEVVITERSESPPVTNVNFVVRPSVLLADGRTWRQIPSGGSIRKALFKDLNRRMKAYKVKGDVRWRRR